MEIKTESQHLRREVANRLRLNVSIGLRTLRLDRDEPQVRRPCCRSLFPMSDLAVLAEGCGFETIATEDNDDFYILTSQIPGIMTLEARSPAQEEKA